MKDLIKKDLKYLWHPYTQMKDCENMPPILIERAEGLKLYDSDGKYYYDTISSWWCNVHGHSHSYIKGAIKRQLDKLEHVLFAGFTHRPAIELSERLVRITPGNLSKVFFSDNGSTAVEVAMKMSFQYWRNIGKENKTVFMSLDMAYHGDTIGAMSVSGKSIFNRTFDPLFVDVLRIPTPLTSSYMSVGEVSDTVTSCLEKAEEILKKRSGDICAIIIEPILMGAGGMIIYPPEYLKGLSVLAKNYDVHLIADEVASGFGRTGRMFASCHAEVVPDFICLSKGITSGYLPMGVTVTNDNIFSAFYDDYSSMKTFYHGHTFTANPISCAAAVASIDLFDMEGTLDKVPGIEKNIEKFLSDISSLKIVGDTRNIGVVGAIDLVKDKNTGEEFTIGERIGRKIYKDGLKNGLVLRPLGNTMYFFLPLCVNPDELGYIFEKTSDILKKIEKEI